MKKLLIAPLVALFAAVFICGCASALLPVEAEEETLEEIKTAYYEENKELFVTEYYSYTKDDISLRYYGNYDGTHVTFIDVPFLAATQAITQQTIGGITINYRDGQWMEAYRDGSFYSLEAAFENGYLKRADLKTIRDLHKQKHKFTY